MKKVIILFGLVVLFILSCGPEVKKTYFEEGGWMEYTVNEKGEKHGIKRLYYPDGQLMEETPMVNGKAEGFGKGYYDTGELDFEAHYVNDLTDGLYKEYYKDGKIKNEVEFKEGKQHGEFKQYYPNGNIEKKQHFINGKQIGYYYSYYKDGTLKLHTILENDTNIVYYIKYDRAGKVLKERRFLNPKGKIDKVIYVGEEYKIPLEITGPVYDDWEMDIYAFIMGDKFVETVLNLGTEQMIGKDTNQAVFTFTPEKTGICRVFIRAKIKHPNQPFTMYDLKDSTMYHLEGGAIIFEVKERVVGS